MKRRRLKPHLPVAPFNPQWSNAARIVYDGILTAMGKDIRTVEMDDELETVEPLA